MYGDHAPIQVVAAALRANTRRYLDEWLPGGKVVGDDDIALTQPGAKDFLHIGQKHFSVHWAINEQGRIDAIAAQGSHKGEAFPMTVGNACAAALAFGGASVETRHFGVEAGFIKKDQLLWMPVFPQSAPCPSGLFNIGAILLGGAKRFF